MGILRRMENSNKKPTPKKKKKAYITLMDAIHV